MVSRGPIPTYSFSDSVSLILGEVAPQPVPHTALRMVSTQIIDAALNMAPNNQKTEVVPPAEVREDLPLPSDPKVIFLGSIRTCGAGGGPCRERNRWRLYTSDLLHWPRWRQRQLSTNITVGSLNEAGQCCGEHRYWRSLS